jgi:hypothetical protein
MGRVTQTSRGRVLDQEDVVFVIMDVRVVVEQLWAGRMPTVPSPSSGPVGNGRQDDPAGEAGATSLASGPGA